MRTHYALFLGIFFLLFTTTYSNSCPDPKCKKHPVEGQCWQNQINVNCDKGGSESEGLTDEIEKRFDIQKENLEYKNTITDRWLTVFGIIIAVFGILLPFAGISYARKLSRDIDNQKDDAKKRLDDFISISEKRIDLVSSLAEMYAEKIKDRHEETEQNYASIQSMFENASRKDSSKEKLEQLFEEIENVKTSSDVDSKEKELARAFEIYYSNSDFNTAISLFKNILDKFSNSLDKYETAQILHSIGYCYNELKNYPEAISAYNAALFYLPNDPDTLNNLGNSHTNLGKYNDAITYLERAIAIDPNDFHFRSNLANLLSRLGRYPEAKNQFEFALNLAPKNSIIIANWIEFNIITNDLYVAKKQLEIYFSLDDHNNFVGNMLKTIISIVESPKSIDIDDSFDFLKNIEGFDEAKEGWSFKELKKCIEESSEINENAKNKIVELISLIQND